MDIAKTLEQLTRLVLNGASKITLTPDFFASVKITDDVIQFLSLRDNNEIELFNILGQHVNQEKIDTILLNKLPKVCRVSPYTKKGKKNYKYWEAKLYTLQNFVFNKVPASFDKEVHDDTYYSAGVIDIETVNYIKYVPKKNIVLETRELKYLLGNELGIRDTYIIDGKTIYAKPLITKYHFNWLVNGKIITKNNYKAVINNYCDNQIELEEQEVANMQQYPDFFNDYPLSAYQKLCKICVANVSINRVNWLIKEINRVFGYNFKDLDAMLDFIDDCRDNKKFDLLKKFDNQSIINVVNRIYEENSEVSLDDEYFGNSIYFEDTVYSVFDDSDDTQRMSEDFLDNGCDEDFLDNGCDEEYEEYEDED